MVSPQREANRASEASSERPAGTLCGWLLTLFFVLVVVTGAAFRLVSLDNRLMHCDEANQAWMFGRLLQEGEYRYDPFEHHGPTLLYATLPVAWLTGSEDLASFTETGLRLAPAVFGILLVAMVWLLREELGRAATFWSALIAAISPAMVFYSRYYIMEMLLVVFTFGAMVSLWRYARLACDASGDEEEPRVWPPLRETCWLISLGVCVGLMHATKETCVIAMFAMAVAGAATLWPLWRLGSKRLAIAGLVAFVSAAVVSVLFFTTIFTNWQGVVDSVTTYLHYSQRATGEGSAGPHDFPWYHYLRILFWWQSGDGPLWTEMPIAVLALIGLAAAILGKCGLRITDADADGTGADGTGAASQVSLARFLAIYTVIMLVVYSGIAYKTPWCVLGMLHGLILLAGIGAAAIVRIMPGRILKCVAIVLLLAASASLAWQSQRASFVACDDPDNPYVYAHSIPAMRLLVDRVKEIADSGGEEPLAIEVICPDADYWPLPWYLRGYKVGYFSKVPKGPGSPIIVYWPAVEGALSHRLYIEPPPGHRVMYMHDYPSAEQAPETHALGWEFRRNTFLKICVRGAVYERL